MSDRLSLHELLCSVLGSRNVYFQPPSNLRMVYPCIVYSKSRIRSLFADGKPYLNLKAYTVTVIYRDPDSEIPDRMAKLPSCVHDRMFVNDNLYHDIFTIYH